MPNYSEKNTETTPQLLLDNVSLKTPIASNYLLENISFQVHKGDRIAIVGPSGAGKTTWDNTVHKIIPICYILVKAVNLILLFLIFMFKIYFL